MNQEYKDTLNWMLEQLPMYQQLGKIAYHPGLGNTNKLDAHLNYPHNNFHSVHIAGTNGKGSTSHMLASILQEAGYKVGLYTSPHLKDYRERIRINGEPISEQAVVDFIKTNKEFLKQSDYSFFEMSVGLAFDYFSENEVDIAIIETGLGGRLDSTNIIKPLVSIITNIGMDHFGMLGGSIEAIAKEKAGIIKEHTPIVIGEATEVTRKIFLEIATEKKADLYWVDQETPHNYSLDLLGSYQKYNVRTVLQAINILIEENELEISQEDIKQGLSHVVANTGLMGRWQILNKKPLVVCDTAHNAHALTRVVEQIKEQEYEQLHFVLGMVSDKDVEKALEVLPQNAVYYFCAPAVNRAMPAETLQEIASNYKLKGKAYPSTKEAYKAAIENTKPQDMVFIAGSNFVVAEIL